MVRIVDWSIRLVQLGCCLFVGWLFGPLGIVLAVFGGGYVLLKKPMRRMDPWEYRYKCKSCHASFPVPRTDQYVRKTCLACGGHDTVRSYWMYW